MSFWPVTLAGAVVVCSAGYVFVRHWRTGGRCTCTTKLTDKNVIITGANTGIGKETALDMVRRGASVVIACRDTTKGEAAAEWIREQEPKSSVKVIKLDLASMKSIREFADQMLNELPKIHILINNAGIMYCPEWKTADGFEMQMGTNHLGHFLLTRLLLDRLKESTPSRVVTVSSLAHETSKLDPEDLFMRKAGYDSWRQYCNSKTANVLFIRILAEKLKGTGVSAFSLHPGAVQTDLQRHAWDKFGVVGRMMQPLVYGFFKTAEEGAQTSIHCAVCPDLEEKSGEYFSDCKVKATGAEAKDMKLAEQLWLVSEKLLGLDPM